MNRYSNDDVAWERLQDHQREEENRDLMAGEPEPLLVTIRRLANRGWLLAGIAARRPPRRVASIRHDGE
jgi:hypothetical protein